MAVFCGIDWSDDHHDVALVDHEGKTLAQLRIGHDVTGFAEGTIRWTLTLAPRDSAEVWLALPAATMPTPSQAAGESALATLE